MTNLKSNYRFSTQVQFMPITLVNEQYTHTTLFFWLFAKHLRRDSHYKRGTSCCNLASLVNLPCSMNRAHWFCLAKVILYTFECVSIAYCKSQRKNAYCRRAILGINVHMVTFRIKLMLVDNFVIDCFPMSHIVFEMHTLTNEFFIRPQHYT